jgi:hypothetical protein
VTIFHVPLELLRPPPSLTRTCSPHESAGAEALKDSGQKDLRLMSDFGPGAAGRRVAHLRGHVNRGASTPLGLRVGFSDLGIDYLNRLVSAARAPANPCTFSPFSGRIEDFWLLCWPKK